jgi:predicted negative regulator of RcsB-dependent stress response
MAYDFEEQEKIDALKEWWKRNGNRVTWAVTGVLLVIAAFQGWRWWQNKEAMEAAALFAGLDQAVRAQDARQVREISGRIMENYPRTAYAPGAAFLAAQANFLAGDLKSAGAQLQWVLDHSGDDAVRQVARVRLAQVFLDEKRYDEALKLLAQEAPPGFESLTASTRGDVLGAQGKNQEARDAYRTALEKAEPDSPLRRLVELKLNALGG